MRITLATFLNLFHQLRTTQKTSKRLTDTERRAADAGSLAHLLPEHLDDRGELCIHKVRHLAALKTIVRFLRTACSFIWGSLFWSWRPLGLKGFWTLWGISVLGSTVIRASLLSGRPTLFEKCPHYRKLFAAQLGGCRARSKLPCQCF